MSDPEPVTDDDGNVLGYECPTCGTLKTTEAKATEHCEDTDPPQEKPTTSDAPDTSPLPDATETAGDPETETDESAPDDQQARVRAAFADAIEWFHTNLDQDLPEDCEYATARAYFTEGRNWNATTIDSKQVGYAPASRTALLDHLMAQGYDRDAILGTGLFWDDLTPIWQGRYVLPYPDADGQPVYAISRAAGHPADSAGDYGDGPAKYHKIPVSRDEVLVEEPIYGLETIESGEPLLITEGIADAITAHEAGYPCLSPVTTQFKHADRERLLEVLDTYDVPAVYVVQDAERPTSDIDENDELTVEQVPPGLKGAVATSAYLDAHSESTEAALAELPRPGLDKVDLDDYLTEWNETLAPILASAKPASEHPAYEPKEHAIETARGSERTDRESTEPTATSGAKSALFDLDIRDVTGMAWDDRGTNPLGHHGESENYFVLIEDRDVAYDHKYKVAYTALTYVLCEAGERRGDSPNGRLDDEEMLAAWLHAKQERYIPDDDPIPHRALCAIARDEDLCDRAAIEDGWKLPREAYDDALTVCRDTDDGYGVDPGRDPIGRWGSDGEADSEDSDTSAQIDTDVDPTTLDVVIDPQLAWRAAKQTTPADLREGRMETLSLATTAEGDRWTCPQCGGGVGIVQAVALDRGTIDCCEEPLRDDDYDTAYWHARTAYGAPLPDFVSTETATDNWHLVQGAVSQLTHHHFSGLESTVTGDGGTDDDIVAVIDPCWADSSSGERIVAFQSGVFYCREHECVIDPLRFVALEHGVIEDCEGALAGDDFTAAYHIAREQYGAPLPEWETGAPDHIPVLPDADDLLGEFTTDKSELDLARDEVTDLVRSCANQPSASVVTTLPALGKTTAIVILADDYPALYLAPRRELMAEVEDKADEWDRTCQHLPIFAAKPPSDAAVTAALDLIREEDKQLLRNREDLLDRIEVPVDADEAEESDDDGLEIRDPDEEYPDAESAHAEGYQSLSAARKEVEEQNTQRRAMTEAQNADDDDADDVDLDRASCPCANGEHGEAWQLVVAVARALGHTPKEIHARDEALFSESLPCQDDDCDGDCEYSIAWEHATDADDPKDILIGHYGHGHVDGARVHRERDSDDHMDITNRTIAIDEFPGDVYDRTFDEEFVDHAAWAASALCPEVDDRQALFEQDLGDDDTLRAWIDGEATETDDAFDATDTRLELLSDLTDARRGAEHTRETLAETDHDDEAEADETEADAAQALIEALDDVLGLGPEWDGEAVETVYTTLRETVTEVGKKHLSLLQACGTIEDEILPALASAATSVEADDSLRATTAPARCGGDLTNLVETAVSAFCEQRDGTQGLIHAAQVALAGGEEGCRELAIHTDDGYAHPMAHLLLDGLIDNDPATDDQESVSPAQSIIPTEEFDFEEDDDGENGTNLARTRNGRHTILTDRNHHGALIRDPPAFQGDDETTSNPVIGLDATGRASLWELAIGCEVETTDIHETPREKRAFLRDVLNLQVVQTSPHVQGYSGPSDSTNFDGPVALVNRIAEEYSASLLRRDTLSSTSHPGVITTKKAENAINDRLSGIGALAHYGDITGSNALGAHNLGIVLGSRHYGDGPVEKWAALGGETVTREGNGATLDYNSPIGNTFLAYMREDETLQAILRFGRDEEGAVVFAHTSALADCLPVVAEGQVVKTFTKNANAITEVARQYRNESFTISDLVDDVDCSRETVRRTLNEFADFGYLTKHETKEGLATDYDGFAEPDAGVVELPELDDPFTPADPSAGGEETEDDHHRSPITRYYTWSVEVDADDLSNSPRRESARATLPAPEKIAAGPPSN
jgi:hypothetical protein